MVRQGLIQFSGILISLLVISFGIIGYTTLVSSLATEYGVGNITNSYNNISESAMYDEMTSSKTNLSSGNIDISGTVDIVTSALKTTLAFVNSRYISVASDYLDAMFSGIGLDFTIVKEFFNIIIVAFFVIAGVNAFLRWYA